MQSRLHRFWIRAALAARKNRAALVFTTVWLFANFILLQRSFGMPTGTAALVAGCIHKVSGGWPGAYQSFTEVVVFGVVASLIVSNVTREYQPALTCRALARRARGHVVVVGYSNLGRRIRDLVDSAGKTVVVVEDNASLVAALVQAERPVVVGSAQERSVLEDAGVAHAKIIVIATDDLETAAVACRLVREMNGGARLVVRCSDDDIGNVLARTYRAQSVSTSRLAADLVQAECTKAKARAVLVFGKNAFGERVAEALDAKRIPHRLEEVTEDPAKLAAMGAAAADFVVICDDDLGKNLIRVDRIRDVNKRTKIICRAFHDEAAEILGRAPLDCMVISTSKHASEALARQGLFSAVGIDNVPERALRTMLAAT